MSALPKALRNLVIPPIKCQGIKTKLLRFIASSTSWQGEGLWIEPFLGSGVVMFNIAPQRAIGADSNPHIIGFYRAVQSGEIAPRDVREHLAREGALLQQRGEEHYYAVRERFNSCGAPLDFLFLNRACFNGLMRFNRSGQFNVPFCRKPDRFRQAYVTKITNQVAAVRRAMAGKDWEFVVADWRETLGRARRDDFLYLDPPYVGRHADYYNQWTDEDAAELARSVQLSQSGFALSMWKANIHRANPHIASCWSNVVERTAQHFYHLGSTEDLRNEMEEALLIRPGFDAHPDASLEARVAVQTSLF